jgi:hypothetical protein
VLNDPNITARIREAHSVREALFDYCRFGQEELLSIGSGEKSCGVELAHGRFVADVHVSCSLINLLSVRWHTPPYSIAAGDWMKQFERHQKVGSKDLRVDFSRLLMMVSEDGFVSVHTEDVLIHVPMSEFMGGRVPLQRSRACTIDEYPSGFSRKNSSKQTFQRSKT